MTMELFMPALIRPGCSCCGNYNFDFYVKFCVVFNALFKIFPVFFFKSLVYLILCGENSEGVSVFGQKKPSFIKESDFYGSWDVWEKQGFVTECHLDHSCITIIISV